MMKKACSYMVQIHVEKPFTLESDAIELFRTEFGGI
jgi:hypothetical protein